MAVQTELLLKQRDRLGTITLDPVSFWVLRLLAKFIFIELSYLVLKQEKMFWQQVLS